MIKNKNIKVFASSEFPEIGLQLLNKAGFTVKSWKENKPISKEELINRLQDFHVLFCTSTIKIDKEFLDACTHLDMISQFAAGYDNVDVLEATKLGIPIGYTPNAMSDATADIAFGLMIATARNMFFMHNTIPKGEWGNFNPKANLGIELKNKTIGILGLGRIGIEMAKRCKGAYNMNILYHNRNPNLTYEEELNAKFVDFDTLLEHSDIISVHCSLNEKTRGIFNKAAFKKMKSTSIFINTSRGQVHNENDLTEALKSGEIWGAGLDVTDPEPMRFDNPLLTLKNVTVLPHIGSATVEARNEMSRLAALNIIEFYKYKKMPHIINPNAVKNN